MHLLPPQSLSRWLWRRSSRSWTANDPPQCRAVRGIAFRTQTKLAEIAGVPRNVIIDFEVSALPPKSAYLEAMRRVLELCGVEFIDGNSPQVRLKAMTPAQLRAARALLALPRPELAKSAVVPLVLIADYEAGVAGLRREDLVAIRAVLENAGVEFTRAG